MPGKPGVGSIDDRLLQVLHLAAAGEDEVDLGVLPSARINRAGSCREDLPSGPGVGVLPGWPLARGGLVEMDLQEIEHTSSVSAREELGSPVFRSGQDMEFDRPAFL
jgi:hypothetical protein